MHAVSNMCFLWKYCGCFSQNKDVESAAEKEPVDIPLINVTENPCPPLANRNHIYKALYNFKPGLPQDLEFLIGDQIELYEEPGDLYCTWNRGKNLRTGEIGLVPINFVAKYSSLDAKEWYFGKISIFAAETMLLYGDNEDGIFLVRSRQQSDAPYALSVTMKSSTTTQPIIKHYVIYYQHQRYYISREATSLSLETLISCYMKDYNNNLKLCTQLIKPYKKSEPMLSELSGEYVKKWEINRSEVELLGEPLDSGNSGDIYKGQWGEKIIAVKSIRSKMANLDEILLEVKQMKALKHRNIISCFGICSEARPYLILMEYMKCGSLLSYIQKNKLNTMNKLYIASQTADGMTYLERKNIIHRDIAARNILIGTKLIAKIADFGLSRYLDNKQLYVMSSETPVPLCWLAPESYNQQEFSIKSDVWSFGIMLMELFTDGRDPYRGVDIGKNAIFLFRQLNSGYRMPQPADMHDDIYQIISSCWNKEPEQRPTFLHLSECLYQQQERFE